LKLLLESLSYIEHQSWGCHLQKYQFSCGIEKKKIEIGLTLYFKDFLRLFFPSPLANSHTNSWGLEGGKYWLKNVLRVKRQLGVFMTLEKYIIVIPVFLR
jgi:hypothetical protein